MTSSRLRLSFVIIVTFILFALLSNYIWIRVDNSIEGTDSQNHLLFSVDFFYKLSDIIHKNTFSIGRKVIQAINLLGRPAGHESVYWPNGINLTASVFYFLFGTSLLSAKLSLLPYLFILLLSTYLIGRLIFSNSVGLLAAFLLFMYPIIFESSRQFQLDFPLTAMLALNILFLIKCNYFKDRKHSFFFGLSLGWAMLIKGQAVLFIIWPLLFILYKTFKNSWKEMWRQFGSSRQLQNMAIFIIVAGGLASIWWAPKVVWAVNAFASHIFSASRSLESNWSWDEKYSLDSISSHFRTLFSSLSPPLYIAFLLSFIFFLKQKVKYKVVFLSWLILPFLLFSLVFTLKHPRFLMPVLPVMALITAWGLYRIKNKKLRIPILSVIVIFVLTQFYVSSYYEWHHEGISIGLLRIFGRTTYEAYTPRKEDLKIDEVVRIIRGHTSFEQPVKIGSIVACGGRPSTFEILYWLRMKDRFLNPIDLTEMHRQFIRDFDSLDFILIRLPYGVSIQWPRNAEFRILLNEIHSTKILQIKAEDFVEWNKLLKMLEDARPDFQLVGKITPSGRSVYYIYKRGAKDNN